MTDPDYISYARARQVLHQAMVSLGSRMVADQVSKIVREDGDSIAHLAALQIKPSAEFLEMARAIEELRRAELRANEHLLANH